MSKINSTQDQDRIIDVHSASNARWAFADAQLGNQYALDAHPDFFGSQQHQERIARVREIVDGFFKIRRNVYVNHRGNRGKPFTTVKVDGPVFPNVSQQRKRDSYLDPLRALGVEIVFSKRTNSYLYHVR